jgi:hypothetical protein
MARLKCLNASKAGDWFAQLILAIGIISYVLPWIGLELLDTARAVAEFDLPGRVLALWWGSP